MGLLIPADMARVLAVTLDGRELARYYVAEVVDDADVLDELGAVLATDIVRRLGATDPGPLDPGPLAVHRHAQLPSDLADAVRMVNDLGDEHVENGAARAMFFGAVETLRAHWCTHAPAPDVQVDESAKEEPPVAQRIESPQVTTAPEDPSSTNATTDEDPPSVGEADRGRATDTVIRRWNTRNGLVVLPSTRQLPSWLRAEYERLRGAAPDDQARERAARLDDSPPPAPGSVNGAELTDSHGDARAMAERMLSNRSTPKAVADATGLDLTEVQDLERALRGKPKGGR